MNTDELREFDSETLERVIQTVKKLTGITMTSGKKTMLQGRLRPRLLQLGLSSYEEYLDYLNSNKEESQEFINRVTTNETSFFRTQKVWDYFQKEFLPSWQKENPSRILKIWSGAASSGEEIYTIGICCEEFKGKFPGFNYHISGSDISSEMLEIAEAGEYNGRSLEAFKTNAPALFSKYMDSTESAFKVKQEIRSHIKFFRHNLFHLPKEQGGYDIVFLRNVLIYFDSKDQEIVLSNIARGLVKKGTLIIGESESLMNLATPFKFIGPLIYEKKEGAA